MTLVHGDRRIRVKDPASSEEYAEGADPRQGALRTVTAGHSPTGVAPDATTDFRGPKEKVTTIDVTIGEEDAKSADSEEKVRDFAIKNPDKFDAIATGFYQEFGGTSALPHGDAPETPPPPMHPRLQLRAQRDRGHPHTMVATPVPRGPGTGRMRRRGTNPRVAAAPRATRTTDGGATQHGAPLSRGNRKKTPTKARHTGQISRCGAAVTPTGRSNSGDVECSVGSPMNSAQDAASPM